MKASSSAFIFEMSSVEGNFIPERAIHNIQTSNTLCSASSPCYNISNFLQKHLVLV